MIIMDYTREIRTSLPELRTYPITTLVYSTALTTPCLETRQSVYVDVWIATKNYPFPMPRTYRTNLTCSYANDYEWGLSSIVVWIHFVLTLTRFKRGRGRAYKNRTPRCNEWIWLDCLFNVWNDQLTQISWAGTTVFLLLLNAQLAHIVCLARKACPVTHCRSISRTTWETVYHSFC